jgi:hypothetical protein
MNTTLKAVAVIISLLLSGSVSSQQLKLGNNPYAVEKSAVLELVSNNQGLLLPRISDTSSINSLNPPDGMVIFFTPDKSLLLRSNGYWRELIVSSSAVVSSLNGNSGALTMDTGYIANFYSKVRSLFSASAPITLSNGQIGISQATTSTHGYLTSTDWNIFNNKQAAGSYITDPGGNGLMVRTALNSSINRALTGTTNRISITNGDGVGGNPTIDIHSSYAGQTSITTLGTIGTGTWNGAKISEAYGGTNQTTYTLGDMLYSSASNTISKLAGNTTTTKKFLSQTGNGSMSASPSWATLSNSDVGLGNVENTALSGWTGSTYITTLGTIGVGVWNGSIIQSAYGGTGNGFTKFTGPVTSEKIFTLPNASATILTSNDVVTIAQGGTGQTTANAALNAFLPSQTSNSGNFLTTDGSNTSWSTINAGDNIIHLSSDVINNNASANTIADVTGLSFSVTAGNTYKFYFMIAYTSAATGTGSRWSINGPATTFLYYHSNYSLTTTTVTTNEGLSSYNVPAAANATSAATGSNIAIIEGIIKPSANGTVIARFASEVASSAITAKTGSFAQYKQIN